MFFFVSSDANFEGGPFRLCRNMWSPLLLCLFCLFHFCNFHLHLLYQLCELFLAFLSCLCVDILGDAFAVESRREPSFVSMLLNDLANGRKKKNCKFRLCFCKSVQGDFVREISSLTTAMQILSIEKKRRA